MIVPASAAPDVQESIRSIIAAVTPFAGPGNVDFHGRRIMNAGRAVKDFDYITKVDLDEAVAGITTKTPTPDTPQTVLYGLHSDRTALAPGAVSDGTLFYETDRAALYQSEVSSTTTIWALVMCRPLRTATTKPADLTTDDAGFTWFDQVEGITWRWSGGAWNYYLGSYVDVFANRPAAALVDRGFLFIASDYGYHVWRKGATDWVLLEGVGGPMRGAIASKPTLAAIDAGFHYWASDFVRIYRWDGAGWGEITVSDQEQISFWKTAPVTVGWGLCDGSTYTRSTATGGTSSVVTPDLVTANKFLRAGSSSGGTGGAASVTIAIDVPSTTSSVPNATTTVDHTLAGATIAVASAAGTVTVDPASFTSPTIATLPPYYQGIPYMRL